MATARLILRSSDVRTVLLFGTSLEALTEPLLEPSSDCLPTSLLRVTMTEMENSILPYNDRERRRLRSQRFMSSEVRMDRSRLQGSAIAMIWLFRAITMATVKPTLPWFARARRPTQILPGTFLRVPTVASWHLRLGLL